MDSPLGPLEGAQCLVTQSCPTLCDLMDLAARLLCPWGLSRQECWSALPCPFLGDLPNPGIELKSPALQVDSLPSELPWKPSSVVSNLFLEEGQRTASHVCLL